MEIFKNKALWIVGAVLLFIIIYIGSAYNGLVTANTAIDGQWAQVESQYQRRFDLIPNLVAAVQGIMKQETAIFTKLAEARSQYAGARTVDQKVTAAQNTDSALARLLVITENYPALKSSENVTALMTQLEGTENRIAVERMRYNESVQNFNLKTKTFPSSIIARMFGFATRAYFKSDQAAATAPKVNF